MNAIKIEFKGDEFSFITRDDSLYIRRAGGPCNYTEKEIVNGKLDDSDPLVTGVGAVASLYKIELYHKLSNYREALTKYKKLRLFA